MHQKEFQAKMSCASFITRFRKRPLAVAVLFFATQAGLIDCEVKPMLLSVTKAPNSACCFQAVVFLSPSWIQASSALDSGSTVRKNGSPLVARARPLASHRLGHNSCRKIWVA